MRVGAAARELGLRVHLVADSTLFQRAIRQAEQAAAHDVPVLLRGEPGTGKGLLARRIHESSARRNGPFVRGRSADAARNGTLYVKEVVALSAEELNRLREDPGVRLVLGTCHPGDFADITINLPPLRERPDDIAALAARFAAPLGLSNRAHELLRRHTWPGNVRELRHVIEHGCTCAGNGLLDDVHLEALLPTASATLDLRVRIQAFERSLFREALRRARGKKSAAARILGFDASNWSYHAKRLGLQ